MKDTPLWVRVVLALALATLMFVLGAEAKMRMFVPANCVGLMKVTAFRKPCRAISDTLALCDQVELHFFCTEYRDDGKR